jgi:hypothetical protein
MPKLFKTVVILQLLVFSLFLFITPVHAQEDSTDVEEEPPATTSEQTPTHPAANPTVNNTTVTSDPQPTKLIEGEGTPISAQNYKAPQNANYTLENLQHSLLCEIAGMSPVGKCIGQQKTQDGKIGAFLYDKIPGGGAIGGLTTATVAMFTNPPTSSREYLASIKESFGAKPAYAQSVSGSGEGIIRPILTLWQVTRNLAYLAFIIVFIAVGFMIMFRTKINPQTVISAQAALPGLVVGLILVTFSYFIASLLIDISFVAMQLVAQLFIQSNAPNFFGDIHNLAQDSNVFHLFTGSFRFGDNFTDVTGGIWRTMLQGQGDALSSTAFAVFLPAIIGGLIGGLLLGPVGGIAGIAAGGGIVPIIGLIVPLILIVVLLIQFFRLFFKLIGAYISLLTGTITAPLVILYSSIPGRGGALGDWFKGMLANALIFPAVFVAFLFAGMILATNPAVWTASPPLFGGLSTELLRILLAYGIILGTPAIPDTVKGAFGVKDLAAGFTKAAASGVVIGAGAATPVASGLGRAGVNLAYGSTKLRDPGSLGQDFHVRLGKLFGNSKWLKQDVKEQTSS